MNGAVVKEVTKRIWEMGRQGKTPSEISAELNLKKMTVISALSRGRAKGEVPPLQPKLTNRYLFRKFGVRAGSITGLLDQLSVDQKCWVLSEASKIGCQTVEEYLLERVRDDYEER